MPFKRCEKKMMNVAYSIEQFQALNKPETMVITQHSRKRFSERGIHLADVCAAIDTGIIIEDYPNDFPFPSCLILGKADRISLHICASISDGFIYIITAYIPNPAKWEGDFKRRKESNP